MSKSPRVAKWTELVEFSPASGWLFFPVSYFAVLLAHLLQLDQSKSLWNLNILGFLISFVTCLLISLSSIIADRISNFERRSMWKFFTVILIGATRGVAIYFSAPRFGFDSGVDLSYRILNSTVTTISWISLLSFLVNSRRNFEARYEYLVLQTILKKRSSLDGTSITREIEAIDRELKLLLAYETALPQFSVAAQEARRKVEELIKPLSHRLWLSSLDQFPKIRFYSLLVDALRDLRFRRFPVSVFYLFTSMVSLSALRPVGEAILTSITVLVTGLIVHLLMGFIQSRRSLLGPALGMLKLLLMIFLSAWIGEAFKIPSFVETRSTIAFLGLAPLPLLLVCFSMITIMESDRDALLTSIEKEISDQPGIQKDSQLAAYLHNSIQSELLALSKKLESAANSQDPEIQRQALEQITSFLNRSLNEDFANFHNFPREKLSRVIANWSGILKISIKNKDLIFVNPGKAVVIVQLIEELASNASKFGTSDELIISLSEVEGDILFETTIPEFKKSNSGLGLGSKLFSIYAVETHAKESNSREKVVRLRI